jgi:hypothetical protein
LTHPVGISIIPADEALFPVTTRTGDVVMTNSVFGEMAELVEGAPLLRAYTRKTRIVGSNPTLSARFQSGFQPLFLWKKRAIYFFLN